MIAAQLMNQNFSRGAPEHTVAASGRETGLRGEVPSGASSPTAPQFQPIDPGVLNAAIPAFFIGRNKDGFWVARDAKGRIGGLFLLESSALSFAQRESRTWGCATIFPTERFELDLTNQGNPFATQLACLKRMITRPWPRLSAMIDGAKKALRWRPEDRHVS